jgi:hypothetical protein
MKVIKGRVQSIYTNRWGETHITVKTKVYTKYIFGGCRGVFKIRLSIPKGRRVVRAELIGETK